MDWHSLIFYSGCVALIYCLYKMRRDWQKNDAVLRKRDAVYTVWYAVLLFFIYSNQQPHWERATNFAAGLEALLVVYWFAIGGATPRKPLRKGV